MAEALTLAFMWFGSALAGATPEILQSALRPVRLVRPEGPPKGLVLYLPGAGDWGPDADRTAREAAAQAYLVAAISPGDLRASAPTGQCWDLGESLRRVAATLAKDAGLPETSRPILIGQGLGASLAYAALVESPPHSFHAVLTLDFCPSQKVDSSLCGPKESGAVWIRDGQPQSVARVGSTWFALASDAPPACAGEGASAFLDRVDNARLVSPGPAQTGVLEGTVSRPSDQMSELLQWLDPRMQGQVSGDTEVQDLAGLPLVEVRATDGESDTLAVMLSGDGGWAALDRGVSAGLAGHGIPTVGWDSLGYFWKARTPDEVARDLTRLLRHYLEAWHKDRAILIGYSFGADALPYVANRLPPDLKGSVDLVAMLGLSPSASFEFHLSDWLSSAPSGSAYAVAPELAKLGWTRRLCVYGKEEADSLCPKLSGPGISVRGMAGDHHFDEDYAGVADLILKALPDAERAPQPQSGTAAGPSGDSEANLSRKQAP